MRTAWGCVALVCCLAGTSAAEPVERGREYRGPAKLSLADTGVTFSMAKGWRGRMAEDSEYFVMDAIGRPAVIYVGVRTMGMMEAKSLLSQPLPIESGVRLEPAGDVSVKGRRIRAQYKVPGPEAARGVIEALVTRDGQAVLFLGIAPKERMVTGELRRLVNNVRIKRSPKVAAGHAPEPTSVDDRQWMFALRGQLLSWTHKGTSHALWLCKNGRHYTRVGDAGFSGKSQAEVEAKHRGAWSVSDGVLRLVFDDRRAATRKVKRSKDGSYTVDGNAAQATPVDCR